MNNQQYEHKVEDAFMRIANQIHGLYSWPVEDAFVSFTVYTRSQPAFVAG